MTHPAGSSAVCVLPARAGKGLLKRLFSARTLGLFEERPASAIESCLSGLLIGTEIEEAPADDAAARGLFRIARRAGPIA